MADEPISDADQGSLFVLPLGSARGAESERPQPWLRGKRQVLVDAFRDGHTLVVFAHQDDDLLWMMPFWPLAAKFVLAGYPPSQVFQRLVQSFPRELNYADRWVPAWGTIDDDVFAEIFTDRCKRAPIVNLQTVKAHLRPHFTPDIRRVVTHNNWGEYGHAQHRVVNVAVRQLAVELDLDVWALGTRVGVMGADQSEYVDVATSTGLPTIEAYFDADLFRVVRNKYLEFAPVASTSELTGKFRQWSPTLWTWSTAQDAFPMGWRPFIQLVNHGVDLTLGNAAVEHLVRDVKPFNECDAADPAARQRYWDLILKVVKR
ncbi:MAG: hypothetical protein ACLPSW_09620 [Roseiarcus sp.]